MSGATTGAARSGSRVSSRQMAYASVNGRKITAIYFRGDAEHCVTGYVVGMDDYHWLIADTQVWQRTHELVLLPKGRVDLIRLSPDSTLDKEPDAVREAIEKQSRGFHVWCEQNNLLRTTSEEQTA